MTAALIAAVVYLLGGYVMLALLAKFEPGTYSEWELLGWCLWWPASLFVGIVFGLAMLCIRGFAAVARWRMS